MSATESSSQINALARRRSTATTRMTEPPQDSARPLADAIHQQCAHVTPEDAARAARAILDQRVVYTATAYDIQIGRLQEIRDGLKAFKGLLDG
jgi:hypothetical protein